MFTEIYTENYKNIHEKAFDFNIERLLPSDWVENNIYLTSAESSDTGYLKYDLTPYFREIVDFFDRDNPLQQGAIMTCAQIGKTTSVLIPSICHTIAEDPCNIMFVSGSEKIVKDTMRDRLDPILKNSKLDHLITPTIVKKKNQRSGDTDFKKEFAGGSLTASTYEKVIFKGFKYKKEIRNSGGNYTHILKKEDFEIYIMWGGFNIVTERKTFEVKTIEDLIKYNLELTDEKTKELGL